MTHVMKMRWCFKIISDVFAKRSAYFLEKTSNSIHPHTYLSGFSSEVPVSCLHSPNKVVYFTYNHHHAATAIIISVNIPSMEIVIERGRRKNLHPAIFNPNCNN